MVVYPIVDVFAGCVHVKAEAAQR